MRRIATLLSLAAIAGSARRRPRCGPPARTDHRRNGHRGQPGDRRVRRAHRRRLRAGLVGTLDGNRQFTVFAPTDAAFEELYAALGVSGVDDIPVATLRAVLLHHVAPGERFSGDVLDATRIRTLNRDFLTPSVAAGAAYIDGARIVIADVMPRMA